MNYSAELIETLKKIKGLAKDAEIVGMLPKATKANISQIKSGLRHLTNEQALWIAEQCQLDPSWVLVNLAEEKAHNDKERAVWSTIAKMIAKTAKALAITGLLLFSQVSGHYPPLRLKHIP
jgi:hypothetical protein